MSVNNIFRRKAVGTRIVDLFAVPPGQTQSVVLTPVDAPYFLYAVQQGRLSKTVDDTSLPLSVTADMYVMDVSSGVAAELMEELEFMEVLGLAAPTSGVWHISPLGDILYGATGLFQRASSLRTDAERQRVLGPVIQFFTDVVIPGRMWRAYTVRRGLANSIEEANALDRHIIGLDRWKSELLGIFPHTS